MRYLVILLFVFGAAALATLVTYQGGQPRAWMDNGMQPDKTEDPHTDWVKNLEQDSRIPEDPLYKKNSSGVNIDDLGQQHRTPEEVASWVSEALSESLTFSASSYEEVVYDASEYFHSAAYQQYKDFLDQGRYAQTVASSNLRLVNFIEDTPYMLTKGEVENRYKWLFDVPMVLSYIREGARGYSDFEPVSQNVQVTVQIGRYRGAGEEGLLIERFTVKSMKNQQDR